MICLYLFPEILSLHRYFAMKRKRNVAPSFSFVNAKTRFAFSYILVALSLGWVGSPDLAGQVLWGAQASGLAAQRAGVSSFTTPISEGRDFLDRPGPGQLSDTETFSSAERGAYASSAALSGNLSGFMTLSTFASTSNDTSVMWSDARGVASFTYTGTETATFEIELTLSGTFSDSGANPSAFSGNFLDAFLIDNSSVQDLEASGFGFEAVAGGPFELWDPAEEVNLAQTTASPTPGSGILSVTVNPGDTFLVFMHARSRMFGFGTADAGNTSLASFVSGPTEDLVVNSIPEPRLAVLALGMAAAFVVWRRRNRR